MSFFLFSVVIHESIYEKRIKNLKKDIFPFDNNVVIGHHTSVYECFWFIVRPNRAQQ